MIRDLSYHVAPFHESEWGTNIERLLKYKDVFTGRRVVAVVYGLGMYTPDQVKSRFPPGWAEFIDVPNDPYCREAATLYCRLWALENRDPNRCTFFAHTKGVRPGRDLNENQARSWRDTMYRECLGDVARVEEQLSRHKATGCFRMANVEYPPPNSLWPHWHYAGAFYWMRNDALYANQRCYTTLRGSHTQELLPGWCLPIEESGCLAHDNWDMKDFGRQD